MKNGLLGISLGNLCMVMAANFSGNAFVHYTLIGLAIVLMLFGVYQIGKHHRETKLAKEV